MTGRSRITGLFAACGVALLLPGAAMAQGMPQLNFSTPLTLSQVVWGAIIFCVLWYVLAERGLPQVGSVLEERAARIGRDLEEARASKARADAGMAEAEQATARARAEAQAAIGNAAARAKQEAAAQAEVLNARLDAQLRTSEAQIAAARASAMNALRTVATDTAATVVERLTGSRADPQQLQQAIDAALSSRGIA
jgi:F-type H+-transporting ATPase subunit b